MPMPPCSCTALWLTNRPDWPTPTFAIEMLRCRSAASGSSTIIAASIAIDRPCSIATSISAARCCRAWFSPIGLPNCTRVFR